MHSCWVYGMESHGYNSSSRKSGIYFSMGASTEWMSI